MIQPDLLTFGNNIKANEKRVMVYTAQYVFWC